MTTTPEPSAAGHAEGDVFHFPLTELVTTQVLRLNAPVHYTSYGTPGGEFAPACRAAIVTAVGGWRTISDQRTADSGNEQPEERTLHQVWDAEIVSLQVFNPTGTFLHEAPHDEDHHLGGTWHWPAEQCGC